MHNEDLQPMSAVDPKLHSGSKEINIWNQQQQLSRSSISSCKFFEIRLEPTIL
jgi:hypothetical protein